MPVQPGRNFQGATGSAEMPGAAAGVGHAPPSGNAAANKRQAQYVGGFFNNNLRLPVTAVSVPLEAEPMGSPKEGVVRIRTFEGNAGTMYFAETREELRQGQGVEIGAGFEVIFPYEKGRFWYMGTTEGDYAILSTRSQ